MFNALKLTVFLFVVSVITQKEQTLIDLFKRGKNVIQTAKEANEILDGLNLLVESSEGGYVYASAFLGNLLTNQSNADLYSPLDGMLFLHRASEQGHQSSMYNFGKLLAEFIRSKDDVVQDLANTLEHIDAITPLEYFDKAYHAKDKFPTLSTPEGTTIAKLSHEIYGKHLLSLSLFGSETLIRVWRAGSLLPSYNPQIDHIFDRLVSRLVKFDSLFRQDAKSLKDWKVIQLLKQIAALATQLLDDYKQDIDAIQYHIFLEYTQDIAGMLAGIDDQYNVFAGRVAETFAFSTYCYSLAAASEEQGACFNGAASSAISYYRRSNLHTDAERVLVTAKQHPTAATNWQTQLQTPRIFHANLTARAWWVQPPLQDEALSSLPFGALIADLSQAVKENKVYLHQRLNNLLSKPDVGLRDTRPPDLQEQVDVTNDGSSSTSDIGGATKSEEGFRMIFTPVIGVRGTDNNPGEPPSKGHGGSNWAEYGPIFNGLIWDEDKCDIIYPLCDILRQPKHSQWMCSGKSSLEVEKKCGTDTAVTLLRLKPGVHILPHCGTTNGRLVKHILLKGGRGVRFRAGDEWLVNYGYPISQEPEAGAVMVFDDSFEHEVKHDGNVGDEDRLVLLVLLRHPDLL